MSNKEMTEKNETAKTEPAKKTPAKTGAKTTAKAPAKKEEASPKPAPKVVPDSAPAPAARKKITPVSLNELVEVRSCVYGELNYHAPSGNHICWTNFDDLNWMTVSDLMEMRNSQRAFFEKNWIVLVGDNAAAVAQYLQIERYYKSINTTEDFDEIFTYDPEDVPAVIEKMSSSIKETVARRAYDLIKTGQLDSNKMISVLEETLGYDLKDPQ